MLLTAYIVSAADGHYVLSTIELPELRTISQTVEGATAAVQAEAARLTGHPADDINRPVSDG